MRSTNLNKIAAKLDTYSGYLFLLGFFTAKGKFIPSAILKPLFNLTSLVAYFIGYILWFGATLFYPHQQRSMQHWYGFAEFKEQFKYSAVLGIIGSLLCITHPLMILPCLWLFALSNGLWCVGEYHKYKNSPKYDKNYASERQYNYLLYAEFMTGISALAAITGSIAIIYPPFIMIDFLCSTVIGTGLTVTGFYFWKKSSFDTYTPDGHKLSYAKMAPALMAGLEPSKLTLEPEDPFLASGAPMSVSYNPLFVSKDTLSTERIGRELDKNNLAPQI